MKFIVRPTKPQRDPPMITHCALCSEDPAFCGDWI